MLTCSASSVGELLMSKYCLRIFSWSSLILVRARLPDCAAAAAAAAAAAVWAACCACRVCELLCNRLALLDAAGGFEDAFKMAFGRAGTLGTIGLGDF